MKIAPGTYYAYKTRKPSPRALRDAQLKEQIMRIHTHRRKRVYGSRKIHTELNRQGTEVAGYTVERLCAELGSAALCAADSRAPRVRPRKPTGPLTWSNATSPPPSPMNSGWPTYVRTDPDGSTSPSCSRCSPE